MKKLLLILFSFCLLALSTCNENPLVDDLQPGRRDYNWEIDTLNIPYTTLWSIWGSSPNDVWVVGPGGDLDKTVYHYDGAKWFNDGISRPFAPTSVYGFSSENVWFCDQMGKIWHFNGNNLYEHSALLVDDSIRPNFQRIWGDAPDNIFATGAYLDENHLFNNGVLSRYDGSTWKVIQTKPIRSLLSHTRSGKSVNVYYISGIRFNNYTYDSSYIYKFNGCDLELFYSGTTSSDDLADVRKIGDYVSLIIGKNIYLNKGRGFDHLLKVNDENFLNGVYGRNEMDVFLPMLDGIAHYNGTDIQYLYRFSNTKIRIAGAVIFEKDVFFLTNDFNSGVNLIFKGKLFDQK